MLSPSGLPIPEEHLTEAWKSNRDGAGFAFVDKGQVWRVRGMFTVKELLHNIKSYELKGKPHMIHLRLGTSGDKTEKNCHPFDAGGQWFMAHNGVFMGIEQKAGESDTAAYVRKYLRPILNMNPRAIKDDPKFVDLVHRTTQYSKMVFLNGQGEYVITHEKDGHWNNNIWYSGKSYVPYIAYQQNNTNRQWVTGHGYCDFKDCIFHHGSWRLKTDVYNADGTFKAPPKALSLVPKRPSEVERFTLMPSHAIQPCESCNTEFGTGKSWYDDADEKVICDSCKALREQGISLVKVPSDVGPVCLTKEDDNEVESGNEAKAQQEP